MRPKAQDAPASHIQQGGRSRISRAIVGHLGVPIVDIRLRAFVVSWASVPETPINEDRDALLGEDNVGRCPYMSNGSAIDPESVSPPMQLATDCQFRPCVTRFVAYHDPTDSWVTSP